MKVKQKLNFLVNNLIEIILGHFHLIKFSYVWYRWIKKLANEILTIFNFCVADGFRVHCKNGGTIFVL